MGVKSSDRRVWQCLMRLKSPEMAPLLDFFKEELSKTDKSLRHAAEPTQIGRLQGRGQWIEDILEGVELAPSVLDGMK